MDVLVLRILTRKSTHKFGYEENRDLTVQQLLDLGKHKTMISSYFGLDRISYIDDVLDELGITEDMRLKKPAKLKGKELNKIINKVMQNMYDSKSDNEKMGASMKAKKIRRVRSTKAIGKIRRNNSRGSLQAKNHGK